MEFDDSGVDAGSARMLVTLKRGEANGAAGGGQQVIEVLPPAQDLTLDVSLPCIVHEFLHLENTL